MKEFRVHSVVDVITNSSTVIYTYSDGSIVPAKELINEFLEVMGIEMKADDMFNFVLMPDDTGLDTFIDNLYEEYMEYDDETEKYVYTDKDEHDPVMCELMNMDWKLRIKYISDIIIKCDLNDEPYPEWLKGIFETQCGDDMNCATVLTIFPKDEKYNKLAETIINFLYSTKQEASYG